MKTVAGTPGRIAPGWRYLTPLVLGSALNPINSSVLATALVAIGQAFRVNAASAAGLVAALYLASAIGQPAMGKLAERFGARKTFCPAWYWSRRAGSSARWRRTSRFC